MTDDGSIGHFAKRFRNEAAACLIQIIRDERASPNARAQAARDILSYSDGKPGTAQPITVASLASLSPDERHELFAALIRYYPEDVNVEGLIQQVVDQVIAQSSKPKLAFRRGKPALPPPSPAHIQKSSLAGRAAGAQEAGPYRASAESLPAVLAPARPLPLDHANSIDPTSPEFRRDPNRGRQDSIELGAPEASANRSERLAALAAPLLPKPMPAVSAGILAHDSRSERLASLAAPLLPRGKPQPVLAQDSGDGMRHALALSRLSASELEARYFGKFTSQDTDPTLWRGKR